MVAALGSAGLLAGAITVFGWMIDETRFDRPDEGFDRLTTRLAGIPGVSVDASQRWVEAPTFLRPSSWVQLTVDESSLPALLDSACSSGYPDAVDWSLRVRTDGGNVVSASTDPEASRGASGDRCPDVGFDLLGVVDQVDRTAQGLDLQAAVWEEGRFALVSLDEDPLGLPALLPLVAGAEDLRDAAGLPRDRSVEVNSSQLILVVEPGEQERYAEVLTGLVAEHGVSSYWADGGGEQIDGVEKVQIVARESEQGPIEEALRTSGLHIADLPVRFLPFTP